VPEPDPSVGAGALIDRMRTAGSSLPVPSARFAVETAFLDLAGQRAARPLWQLLTRSDREVSAVPLCSLVGSADEPGVVDAARAAIDRGAASVKLKISGVGSAERLSRLHAVRRAIGGAGLRLDANGTLPPDRARTELIEFRDLEIEFIEEPVASSVLESLGEPPVPVALDESLQGSNGWERAGTHPTAFGIVALVLKPMTLGGVSACIDWAERARERGLDVVLSHLFDGPIALTACAHLALALGSRRYGGGLDEHGGLRAWPHTPLPLHTNSAIVPNDVAGLGVPTLLGSRR
jgi:L-alanine-DL-glutamate epimerase-like enolase superfamily enzyme